MKLTTNQKLAALANSLGNSEDYELSQQLKKSRASERLRRTSLYGGGARAPIPKISKASLAERYAEESQMLFSPFRVSHEAATYSDNIPLGSSIPPGSHDEQYKMVTNPTQKSYNDPDRVFFNSTSIKGDLIVVPGGQPPWYYGNNNKTKPPDANYATMAASRYGFRGSKDIRQRHTEPYERSTNTLTEHTPKFLQRDYVADEWVPPIRAAVHNTINGYESPKLWPENSEYATGCPLKRPPSSYRYNRETTIDQGERPQSSQAISNIMERSFERELLHEYGKKEAARTFNSKPMHDRERFEINWAARLNRDANSTLKTTMTREVPAHEPHTLSDPTDVMQYSGTSAFIVHTKSNEEMIFRIRMEKGIDNIPYEMRWKHVMAQLKRLKAGCKRNPDLLLTFMDDLAKELRAAAMKAGTQTSLKRVDFMRALSRVPALEGVEPKQLSILYSVYDPVKKNVVQFVDLLCSFAVLLNEKDSNDKKLADLWWLMENYGNDRSPFEKALSVLCSVCSSDEERHKMSEFFKAYFRPLCYRLAILPSTGIGAGRGGVGAMGGLGDGPEEREGGVLASPKKVPGLSVPPAYNITDNYLTRETFIANTNSCVMLIGLFDKLLGERLVDFIGTDPRPSAQERERMLARSNREKFKWMRRSEKQKNSA